MKKTVLILFLLTSLNTQAQIRGMFDSIRYDLQMEKSWFICLDGKNSIIRDLNIKLFGLQTGYTFNGRTNLYLGYYGSYNHESLVIENPTAKTGKTDSNTVFARYRLSYFNLGCEYYFVNSKKWRMSFPVGLGLGKGSDEKYKVLNSKERPFENKTSTVMPLELGFYINYKIKWWIWAGAGLGTRFSLNASQYSGSYYTYGLSIKFGEIYYRGRAWYREKHIP